MCIFYAIMLWCKKGGNFLFQVKPGFHVMVCNSEGIWHGTTKGGRWHVEKLDPLAFSRWICREKEEKTS